MKYGLGLFAQATLARWILFSLLFFLLHYFVILPSIFFFNPLALFPFHITSYQILCPKQLQGVADPKKAAELILSSTGLADDAFRLGNTKARFMFSNSSFGFFVINSRCCYRRVFSLHNWDCDFISNDDLYYRCFYVVAIIKIIQCFLVDWSNWSLSSKLIKSQINIHWDSNQCGLLCFDYIILYKIYCSKHQQSHFYVAFERQLQQLSNKNVCWKQKENTPKTIRHLDSTCVHCIIQNCTSLLWFLFCAK